MDEATIEDALEDVELTTATDELGTEELATEELATVEETTDEDTTDDEATEEDGEPAAAEDDTGPVP